MRHVFPLLLILLAAALAPPAAAESSHTSHGQHTLRLTEVHTPAAPVVMDVNCIHIRDEATDLHGNLTATWDAASPLTERLEIVAYLHQTGETLRAAGTSPVTLPIAGVDLVAHANGYPSLMVSVQLPTWGVAYEQEVTLEHHLTYTAPAPVQVGETGCAV